jgi:hypothetical protein
MDSFLGALAGVLKALGDETGIEELWGLSARGFRTQIHRTLQPLGLLGGHWDKTCARVVRRMGHDCIAGLRDNFYTDKDLHELQVVWMRNVEKALNDGRPAICFGLHGPAFGIIHGLDPDSEEYQVSTYMDGQNDAPINIQDIGSKHPPLIFVLILTGPLADYDPDRAAREAIREALDHHLGQEKDEAGNAQPVPPDLVVGIAAYNAWATAVELAQVEPYWGIGYYAGYYAEGRSAAAFWLRTLAETPAFAANQGGLRRAAGHLEHESESLARIPQLFPMQQPELLKEQSRRTAASACLRLARGEHIAAMEVLAEAGVAE